MVLLALPLAWYASVIQEHHQQIAIVEKLDELDLSIVWRPTGPSWLPQSEAFQRVDQLTAAGSKRKHVTNDAVRQMAELSELTALHLDGASITDEGLHYLTSLKELKDLDLSETQITDAGLRSLVGLKQLEVLSLTFVGSAFDGRITDQGIYDLVTRLPNLRVLDLMGTDAGERTIKALYTIPRLQSVDLRETCVSPAAIENLRKARPEVSVLSD